MNKDDKLKFIEPMCLNEHASVHCLKDAMPLNAFNQLQKICEGIGKIVIIILLFTPILIMAR